LHSDYSFFNPRLSEPVHFPAGQENKSIVHNLTFGPSFFSTFHNIPSAKYVFAIPWAHEDRNSSVEWAKAGYKAIGADRIAALEVPLSPHML
jgi:hypothetical protein